MNTAKVPIVKFRHRRSQLEGDISMYNLLVSIFCLILNNKYS
jgi:DNA polymerase sigma